jgi:hypothetical protein
MPCHDPWNGDIFKTVGIINHGRLRWMFRQELIAIHPPLGIA